VRWTGGGSYRHVEYGNTCILITTENELLLAKESKLLYTAKIAFVF